MQPEKKPSFFSHFRLPSYPEINIAIKTFSKKEKIAFFIFFAIFIAGALGTIITLNNSISIEVPKSSGTLSMGIIGTPRFINPILEISDADRDVTALVYSGLLRPDNNGGLKTDLAETYSESEDGLSYTFTLKNDARFHDGKPVTSDDVIFTINQIKDPVLKSPKRASWEGVEMEKIDDKTFKFILGQPYSPFLENTTIGILPHHIWKEASSGLMSFSEFNINPTGSGPYKLKKTYKNSAGVVVSYTLVANENFSLGEPFIKKLIINFYPNEEKLINAFQNNEISTIGGISPENASKIKEGNFNLNTLNLPRVFGVFFNQNNAPIFAKKEVREALNQATDKKKIIETVLMGFGAEINSPIPPGTFGAYEIDSSNEEATDNWENKLAKAKEILEKAGWKFNEETKIFEKKSGKEILRLDFSISTSNVPELKQTGELIKSMWEELGAKVDLKIFEISDLNQNVIRPRKYDSLIFGEILSHDPDPFAFWHSSQRNDPGLNIALYANITVDKLLEEARKTKEREERMNKYLKFQEEVKKDMPAVFLYSPSYIYITPKSLKGFDTTNITLPSERFNNINKWYLKTKKVWKIFSN
ncbi:MAG: peptide ABC transporter substrate-binding protein [Parcubacteria group bacterium]|nr:peptide ABC transporter substrate-binding protein [Parcubacteria group bacterium]MCR4342289.1 peptide ABC transporter substrate-binding protein [Patescibacteria group bacterium]